MKKSNTYYGFLLLMLLIMAVPGTAAIDAYQSLNDRPLALVTRMIPSMDVNNLERDTTASQGFELFSGDTLQTDENGFALVVFMDRSTVKVRPRSWMVIRGEIDRDQNSGTRIDMEQGGIFIELEKRPNNELQVFSTNTVATVKGTKFGARDDGYHWVTEGEIEVVLRETGETVTVTAGMYVRINDDGTGLVTGTLTDGELDEHYRDYRILDRELIEKRLILRFRDVNGQLREEEVIYYEQEN